MENSNGTDADKVEDADLSVSAYIEGGDIDLGSEPPAFREEEHRAETARSLALWLVGIMGGTVGVHYVLVTILVCNGQEKATEELTKIFTTWLPAITGLVGAATTYYFTKESRKAKE